MAKHNYPDDIDSTAIPFLDRLNALEGIETRSSCIGNDGEQGHVGLRISWSFDRIFDLFKLVDDIFLKSFSRHASIQLSGFETDEPCWVIWLDNWSTQIDTLVGLCRMSACEHNWNDDLWIDIRNEVVLSGEMCPKCGALREGDES